MPEWIVVILLTLPASGGTRTIEIHDPAGAHADSTSCDRRASRLRDELLTSPDVVSVSVDCEPV